MKDNDGMHQNMLFVEAVHKQTVCHLFVNEITCIMSDVCLWLAL